MARTKVEEKKVKISWKEIKKQKFLIIGAIFLVAYGILFYYWPLTGWLMAFENYKPKSGILGSKFVGLDKFRFLFGDDVFIKAVRNTFAMGVINIVTTTFMAVLTAVLLNEVKRAWIKKPIQTISYLPHFLSWIVVTGILHDSLSASGIVNDLLLRFGVIKQAINFFAHTEYFWWIVAFAQNWKETGWNAIIYLAAITAIDPALYEAASIDGANVFQRIFKVTIPMIMPTTVILFLMSVGGIFKGNFDMFYNLVGSNGLLFNYTDVIDTLTNRALLTSQDFGMGAAIGLFQSILCFVTILLANHLVGLYEKDYTLF